MDHIAIEEKKNMRNVNELWFEKALRRLITGAWALRGIGSRDYSPTTTERIVEKAVDFIKSPRIVVEV